MLEDAAGQRELIEHFYGGLLDDELRALADIAATMPPAAPARATKGHSRRSSPRRSKRALSEPKSSAKPIEPSASPLGDTLENGNGFARNLYQLCSINSAGSPSAPTPSVGPIYTRTVRPSRAPVLYKVAPQPGTGAFIVAWALDASPDIAGYLVYRAPDAEELDGRALVGARSRDARWNRKSWRGCRSPPAPGPRSRSPPANATPV